MKLITLITIISHFLLLSFNSAIAQEIQWTEDIKVKYFINVITVNENEYYSWTAYGGFSTLSHFSGSKCDGESGKIVFANKFKNLLRNDCFVIGENLVFIYSVLEKKEVKTYARQYGKNCMPLAEPILLSSAPCDSKINLNKLVSASQSPNRQFIAISFRKSDEYNRSPEFISKVYDAQMNLVIEKNCIMKYPGNKLVWDRFIVTDLGEMIFGFYYLFSTTQSQYMVEIQKENSSENITYNFLENHAMYLSYDHQAGELILAEHVYLQEPENELVLSGIVIDLKDSKKTEIYQTFSNEILLEGLSKKDLESFEGENKPGKLLRELEHYKFKGIIASPDRGCVIVMEADYNNITTYNTPSGAQSSGDYFAEGLLVFKLDGENNLSWVKKVPKSQMAGRLDELKIGAFCFNVNNQLIILFNDNVKNYLESGEFNMENQEIQSLQVDLINQVCLAKVEVDLISGEMERTAWIKDNDSYATPKYFNYNPLNSALVLNYYRMKKQKFGLLKF